MSRATIRIAKACSCGATMQATYIGDEFVGVELEAAWSQLHHGEEHKPASSDEAAKARRRRLLSNDFGGERT